jgi:HEAT repeat protein
MKYSLLLCLFFFTGFCLFAEEPGTAVPAEAAAEGAESSGEPAAPGARTPEERRMDTIRYGTEAEIVGLIQTLKNENADYLDDALADLVRTTRNRNILSGVFSFFGDRAKGGLEDRALQSIENRGEEANETVLAAVDYLGKVKAARAVPSLESLLDSDEQRFINAGIRALGRAAGGGGEEEKDEAAEYLIDFYTNRDPGSENRREIIAALGETGSQKSGTFLADIAGNEDEQAALRMASLEALAKLGDGGGLEAVLKAAASTDPNVRASAVGALGPFSDPSVDAAILEAFRDAYYRTRIAAARAAGERKFGEAAPYLRYRAEQDEVPAVKDEAIRAMGAIGNEASVNALEALFGERKNADRVRILAAEMLLRCDADRYAARVILELDEAKAKRQTPLYNGFLRVLGGAKTRKLEDLARRFFLAGDVVEKSYALDMSANNGLTALIEEVRKLTDEKNGSLAGKARGVLEKLETGTVPAEQPAEVPADLPQAE